MSNIEFNDVVDTLHRVNDAKATSLPQFTRPALIESPLFLQESLIEEPIVNDVIKNLYNVYTGYILLALQMNDMVVGNRTVRDILGTVSTSGVGLATESYIDSGSLVDGLSASLEYRDESERGIVDRAGGGGSSTRHSVKSEMPIASGRQIEVKFQAGEGQDPITVMLNVKFNPRLVPESVMEYVISANFNLDIAKRWLQMRSGEIRFIQDFLLNIDKLNRRAKALKEDRGGVLQDIFSHQNVSKLRTLLKAAIGRHKSYNLANSVLMIDDFTANKFGKKSGLNLDNVRDRNRFFQSTYNLFIVLIDSRYSRVTIYTNGIDQSASFSFNEMKSAASSDKMSLSEIMEYMSKNQTPKF